MSNSIKVKEVYPAEDLHLIVIFENGKVKSYDVTQLFEQFPDYRRCVIPIFSTLYTLTAEDVQLLGTASLIFLNASFGKMA